MPNGESPKNVLVLQAEPLGKARNYPFHEVATAMIKHMLEGHTCFVKWTCGKCKERVISNESNRISSNMKHEECGHTTDIEVAGAGLLVMMQNQTMESVANYLAKMVKHHGSD